MSARDTILARLAAHRKPVPRPDVPVPAIARTEGRARLDRFVERAEAADARVTRLAGWADLPQAVAAILRGANLPMQLRCGTDPAFDLDWTPIERSIGPGRIDEPVTLSRATLASAETGSVVLESGPDNPVTLTFLGETHLVAIAASDVCAGYEEVFARWRAAGRDPRTLNLVTGPSRSADIGQRLQLGAHGPVTLHVLLIEGA